MTELLIRFYGETLSVHYGMLYGMFGTPTQISVTTTFFKPDTQRHSKSQN